jgi:hypothetical protein
MIFAIQQRFIGTVTCNFRIGSSIKGENVKKVILFASIVFFLVLLASMALGQMAADKTAVVPESRYLRYEGLLVDSAGQGQLGDFSMVFRIFDSIDSRMPIWEESHQVAVADGRFEVTLGRKMKLPTYEGLSRYIGVTIDGEELLPRQSVVAISRKNDIDITTGDDKAKGSPELDKDPYIGGVDIFVDVAGDTMVGDLYVDTKIGIGTRSPTSKLEVEGSSSLKPIVFMRNNNGVKALHVEGYSYQDSISIGIHSWARNYNSGDACAGRFETDVSGSGTHYGLYSTSTASSTQPTYGTYNYAHNLGSGQVFGGYFETDASGVGRHYGLRAEGHGASSNPVYGTYGYASNNAPGNAYGGYFVANSAGSGTHFGVWGQEAAGGSGSALHAAGDFTASGSKSAVVRTASSGHRLFYTVESPEVWFEDVGEGQLVNGSAHVELDPIFLETVTIDDSHPMKVFIQLEDDCRGTYVEKGNTSFDVLELQGGTSNAAFSYRVMAKRKGYEDERLRETDVGYNDPTLYPELLAERE